MTRINLKNISNSKISTLNKFKLNFKGTARIPITKNIKVCCAS